MRNLPLAAALFFVAFVASAAAADIPDPPNATLPPGIVLVGEAGGVTDPAGNFTVIVRDMANNPVANAIVVIEFYQCGTDIGVCAVPGLPGIQVQCQPPSVEAITDLDGVAHFAIRGGSNTLNPTTVGMCARFYADGVLFGSRSVAAFDLDGRGGVGPPDISRWLSDYFTGATTGVQFSRSDYDFNGNVGPPDLSLLLRTALRGLSRGSCSNTCN